MGFARAIMMSVVLFFVLSIGIPFSLQAQEMERIWGRVTTVTGDVHQGFIRWDRNEGGWADLLDGSKEFSPFLFRDWWNLVHPDDRHRDRIVELAGYRARASKEEEEAQGEGGHRETSNTGEAVHGELSNRWKVRMAVV